MEGKVRPEMKPPILFIGDCSSVGAKKISLPKRGAESVRARTCALGLTGEYACGHWILRLSIVEMVARSAFECGSGCFPEPTEPPKVCCPISIGTIRSGVV